MPVTLKDKIRELIRPYAISYGEDYDLENFVGWKWSKFADDAWYAFQQSEAYHNKIVPQLERWTRYRYDKGTFRVTTQQAAESVLDDAADEWYVGFARGAGVQKKYRP